MSPYYLGPNAIPVPDFQKGIIKESREIKIDYQYHWGTNDITNSINLGLYIPLLKDRIALEFYGVIYEHFNTGQDLILERRIRYRDGRGSAIGDFYFATIIQLLRNHKILPDLAFRMACKTASGNKLGNARYIDAPGYFFDLSMGKSLTGNSSAVALRLHAMAGFYSWQMNLPNNRQNDAILFGLGLDLEYKKWILNNALKGYYGYLGNEEVIVGNPDDPVIFRDRPVLYVLEFGRNIGSSTLSLKYTSPLNDFYYQSLGLSFIFR
jgi:hypothetical protein